MLHKSIFFMCVCTIDQSWHHVIVIPASLYNDIHDNQHTLKTLKRAKTKQSTSGVYWKLNFTNHKSPTQIEVEGKYKINNTVKVVMKILYYLSVSQCSMMLSIDESWNRTMLVIIILLEIHYMKKIMLFSNLKTLWFLKMYKFLENLAISWKSELVTRKRIHWHCHVW